MNNKTKFIKFGIAVLLGAGAAGFLYAQLSIPTDIDNSVMTIKQINITQSGQATTPKIVIDGSATDNNFLKVEGNIVMGTIAGASTNKVSGDKSSVLGGGLNTITNSNQATVIGGNTNTITNSNFSVIAGGQNNKINANYGFIAGGTNNTVNGLYGFAGGFKAVSNAAGTFVWADNSTTSAFTGSVPNSFVVRAASGVGINTGVPTPGYGLTVAGNGIVYGNLKTNNMIAGAYYYQAITSEDDAYELKISQWEGTGDIYYNSGYVGIGTNNPTAQLHVDGAVKFQNLGSVSTSNTGLVIESNGDIKPRAFNAAAFNGVTETDPTVRTFAKTNLPTCGAGQVLKGDGTSLSCVTDIDTDTKPSSTPCTATQKLTWNGTSFSCATDIDTDTDTKPSSTPCTAGQKLTWNGTTFSCATDIDTDTKPSSTPCTATQKLTWDGTTFSCTTDIDTDTDTKPSSTPCTAGQKLTWNGSIFSCATDADTKPSSTPCTAGQKLTWNGASFSCVIEDDPQIGGLTAGKMCTTDGTTVNCTTNLPTTPTNYVTTDTNQFIFGAKTFGSNITISPSASNRIYMGGTQGGVFGIAYDSSNPTYGIFYTEGPTDYVSLSPNGNTVTPVMKVDGNGTVGIGTANPQSKLHIVGSSPVITLEGTTDDITKINFIDDSSVAGELSVNRSDGITKLWTTELLSFGAANQEQMRILGNGNVGIGTTTPAVKLDVNGEIRTSDKFRLGTSNNYMFSNAGYLGLFSAGNEITIGGGTTTLYVNYRAAGGTSTPANWIWNAGASNLYANHTMGNITALGTVTATAFYYSSDITLKKDLTKISNPLEKILALNGYYFTWKSDNTKDLGVVAQDVEKVFPDAVKTDDKGLKSVKYGNLIAPIIEAIKELYANYLDQQTKISTLEKRIEMLEKNMK